MLSQRAPYLKWLTIVIPIFKCRNGNGAVSLNISKDFDRVWHAGLLHKLKSYGISGQIFGSISSFLSSRRLRVILDGKSSQEHPVNAGVPQCSILGTTLFLLHINDLPDDGVCNIAIYADDTTVYSYCNQASGLWQQLELAAELESDLRDTVDWAGSGLLVSVLEILNLFCLTSLIALVLLMWKWIGLLLRKNCLLRCWGCFRVLSPDGARWFYKLPYGAAWNTVVMTGLVLLAATWKC